MAITTNPIGEHTAPITVDNPPNNVDKGRKIWINSPKGIKTAPKIPINPPTTTTTIPIWVTNSLLLEIQSLTGIITSLILLMSGNKASEI